MSLYDDGDGCSVLKLGPVAIDQTRPDRKKPSKTRPIGHGHGPRELVMVMVFKIPPYKNH